MFSHACLGSNDPAALLGFYDAVLAPLRLARFLTTPEVAGWRCGDGPALYVGRPIDGGAAHPGNGTMLAFKAPSRAAVRAAHAAALGAGGTCEGAPGLRPHYFADYYGAYMRDPHGNKLHVVHRGG